MKFFLLALSLICVLDAVRCQTPPNNTYNVPLLDFSADPVNKSSFCSTPRCCPIALTFDDGPVGTAGGSTDAIINYLHNINISATFFIDSDKYADLNTNRVSQESVKNMFKYDFNVGTHTVDHTDLTTLSEKNIINEITGIQTTLSKFISPAPRLSLFRAPYGAPYCCGNQTSMDFVSKIAAAAGYFHVGWQIDPMDWNCPPDNVTCVVDPILTAVDEGQWGIILLHCVHQNTANALPSLIAGLRQRGCEFFTVEQFVRAKFGKSSAEAIDDFNQKSKAAITTSTTPIMVIFIFCTLFLCFQK